MNQRQQNSTNYPTTFFMTDSTDHITGKTGLTPTVTISKNGAGFGAATGEVSEVGNGWYALAGNATDRNTLGDLAINAAAAGADDFDGRYVIVPWNPFDATDLGLTDLHAIFALIADAKINAQIKGWDDINLTTKMKADVNAEADAALTEYGANTTVPDAAGTAAALHATTDGKIDTLLSRISASVATALTKIADAAIAGTETAGSLLRLFYDRVTGAVALDSTVAKEATLNTKIPTALTFTGSDVKATLDGEKVTLSDATEGQIDAIETALLRSLGLALENHVEDDIVRDGNGLKTSSKMYLYDSKAHATTHDKATGLLAKYTMTATYADSKLTLFKVVKD